MATYTLLTNKYHFLINPIVSSSSIIFYAWVLPDFVSHQMLGATVLFISLLFAVIAAIGRWGKDYGLTQQIKQSPEPADVVWERCKRNKTPYAVYLRSFNFERGQNSSPLLSFVSGKNFGGSARRVEIMLVKALNEGMPILALSDPSDPFSMPGAHRFRSLPQPWLIFIEPLLKESSLIVFYIAEYNPGLMFETNLVRELALTDKVLVIIGRTYMDDSKSFSNFKQVLYENDPHFENLLAETVRFFAKTDREKLSGQSAFETPIYGLSQTTRGSVWQGRSLSTVVKTNSLLKITVQTFTFVLPLIMAFLIWGMPEVLLREYWLDNKPALEMPKKRNDIIKKPNDANKQYPPFYLPK